MTPHDCRIGKSTRHTWGMAPLQLAASLAMAYVTLAADTAAAQSASVPSSKVAEVLNIEAPALIISEPGSGTRVSIKLFPATALPPNSYLRIKGLPASVYPSDGHQVAVGSWAVPLDGLDQLRFKFQGGPQSRNEVALTIMSIDGQVLADARTVLAVAPTGLISPDATIGAIGPLVKAPTRVAPTQAPSTASIAPAPPPAASSPPSPSPAPVTSTPVPAQQMTEEVRSQARRLYERGMGQLSAGGIVAARSLFERAADLGLPESAMQLATTYDATELARLGVVGLQGDPAIARTWYQRALALGATEAAERIARLGN
jgi:hypothetical protein